MFDLVEHTKSYSGSDGSVNIDLMLQNNIDRRIRSEELETEILTLAGQMNAVQYRFIKLLAEFDENGGWRGDGIHSFAHWLNWKMVGPRRMGMMMGHDTGRHP